MKTLGLLWAIRLLLALALVWWLAWTSIAILTLELLQLTEQWMNQPVTLKRALVIISWLLIALAGEYIIIRLVQRQRKQGKA
ncbi:hypothetical protein CL629_01120 [bacterium]|nr:hypothetical protein [bacterium]